MNLLQNISDNYALLQDEFFGFSLNIVGIGNFFLQILIAVGIFITFYFLGKKIRELFFKDNKQYNFFVNVALGYIVFGSGIGLLGIFSLLRTEVITAYVLGILIISFYSFSFRNFFSSWSSRIRDILSGTFLRSKNSSRLIAIRLPKDFVFWGVLLFVIIAFLRLITPEIAEDGYHTDLPLLYLSTHTSIHETKEMLHVIPYPQLPEMIYLIPIFLDNKEATRIIHFGFYLLVIFLLLQLVRKREYEYAAYVPLVFVTTPLVIRYSVSQHTDFFMLFAFLLSLMLLGKETTRKSVILSGVIFGAVLATKIWMLVYVPAVLLYLAILKRKLKKAQIIQGCLLFLASALSIPLLWYIRAYLITGNPLYPIFAKVEYLEVGHTMVTAPVLQYFGFNSLMFTYPNLIVLSPLFFLGIVFCAVYYKEIIKLIIRSPLTIFVFILTLEQLFIQVYLGRYLFAWYTVSAVVVSAGLFVALRRNVIIRLCFILVFFMLFLYYFISTVFVLPYGFGWADKSSYLTRVLGRDNVSYYDFDHLFDKWISEKDLVGTYGIGSFYYADFNYVDIGYIFSQDNRSFDLLKKNKVSHLLIKGGDINWFCQRLALTHCDPNKVKLLATWPADLKKYNLYAVKP